MKKNILLHGATNCNSSNYGDYIYADMIYQHFNNNNYNVKFYQPSNFFKEHLINYDENSFKTSKFSTLIYIPGGYFGEGHNPTLKDNILQFLRFMPIGIYSVLFKKKIIILAIGASPLKNFFLKKSVKFICNHSLLITTRDDESYTCLSKLCESRNIYNCGDLILTYKPEEHLLYTKQIKKIIEKSKNKKIVLIHYNHEEIALNKFAESLNHFDNEYGEQDEFFYVVISDSILDNSKQLFDKFHHIFNKVNYFNYSNPYELSALINISSVVITSKLHVGVIACMLNKSVISVACHYEKTKRFYEQIKEKDRCISLYDCTSEDIYELIKKYYKKNIIIPKKVYKNSSLTWEKLEEDEVKI